MTANITITVDQRDNVLKVRMRRCGIRRPGPARPDSTRAVLHAGDPKRNTPARSARKRVTGAEAAAAPLAPGPKMESCRKDQDRSAEADCSTAWRVLCPECATGNRNLGK